MTRMRRPILATLIMIAGAGLWQAAALAAETGTGTMLKVVVDQARVMKVGRPSGTVIIGNPSIVDVAVQDSQTLVLTGKSFGITNLVVLDLDGKPLMDESVVVVGSEKGTVRIYRQAARTTFACAPVCEPTATIGDENYSFQDAVQQYNSRQAMSKGAPE